MHAHELIGVRADATLGEIELATQTRLAELRAQARSAPNDEVRTEVVLQMRAVERACAELEADWAGIDPRGIGYRRDLMPFSPAAAIVGGALVAALVALTALYLFVSAPGLFCYEGQC